MRLGGGRGAMNMGSGWLVMVLCSPGQLGQCRRAGIESLLRERMGFVVSRSVIDVVVHGDGMRLILIVS